MSNPWAGQMAKHIASRRRPRWFWNLFFGVAIFLILISFLFFIYNVLCDHSIYESEQIFIACQETNLITDINSFEIVEKDKQEVKIFKLKETIKSGDKITVTVSSISGDLIQVEHKDIVVYKKETTPILPGVLGFAFLGLPCLAFSIFMLIVTNIKNPGKRISKLQKEFLLKFYK